MEPCLPTSTKRLPSGKGWLHEIKHDGFRVIARKRGNRVRLYSRPGNDLTRRFRSFRSTTCLVPRGVGGTRAWHQSGPYTLTGYFSR
jgi:ATP-dependent DNA ligase